MPQLSHRLQQTCLVGPGEDFEVSRDSTGDQQGPPGFLWNVICETGSVGCVQQLTMEPPSLSVMAEAHSGVRHIPEAAAGCPCPRAGIQVNSCPTAGVSAEALALSAPRKLIPGNAAAPWAGQLLRMLVSFSQGAELFLPYVKLVYHDSSYCCCHQLCQGLTRRREFLGTAKNMFLLVIFFFSSCCFH